jgi:hypothetical protein
MKSESESPWTARFILAAEQVLKAKGEVSNDLVAQAMGQDVPEHPASWGSAMRAFASKFHLTPVHAREAQG